MVQELLLVKPSRVLQLPACPPVARENGPLKVRVMLRVEPVALLRVRFWTALVLPTIVVPWNTRGAGVTIRFTPVPLRATGELVTVAVV